MRELYQGAWNSTYGETAIIDGRISETAGKWFDYLSDLSEQEIYAGLQKLKYRDNEFPPNLQTFRQMCDSNNFDNTWQEIKTFINRGHDSDIWWQSELAFNVFRGMHFVAQEGLSTKQLRAKAEKVYQMIDRSTLFPIPPQPVAELPKLEDDEWTIRKRHFHSLLVQALYRKDPELFITDKLEPLTARQANREPQRDLPPLMKKLFNPTNALGLMKKFTETTQFSEKRPRLKDFESKADWKQDFQLWKEKADKAMDVFVQVVA